MFGGTFYQSFSATLPAPNDTWFFNGTIFDTNNILKEITYSDATTVNARYIVLESLTSIIAAPFDVKLKGINVLHQETEETVTILADNTPALSANKYIYLSEIKLVTNVTPVMTIGYAHGQSQLLGYNGGTTNHFVNINGGAATWTVWGYIPTKLTTIADITKYKSSLDTLLTGINTTTPTSVRVDKPFGYLWIETNSGQTSEVNWVAGIKTIII